MDVDVVGEARICELETWRPRWLKTSWSNNRSSCSATVKSGGSCWLGRRRDGETPIETWIRSPIIQDENTRWCYYPRQGKVAGTKLRREQHQQRRNKRIDEWRNRARMIRKRHQSRGPGAGGQRHHRCRGWRLMAPPWLSCLGAF